MRTEQDIREKVDELRDSIRNPQTAQEKAMTYHFTVAIATLEWVLEEREWYRNDSFSRY